MFTWSFWKQALERAVKSAAQVLAALVVADGFDILAADWRAFAAVGGGAALASLLTSIATSGVGEKDSPSAVSITSPPAPEYRDIGHE